MLTAPRHPAARYRAPSLGLTLIELMLVIAVLGVLIVLAGSVYPNYREKIRVHQARDEIAVISMHIESSHLDNGNYPASLAEIGQAGSDPWGNAYAYADLSEPGNGEARKDRKLNPLNADFDLYSLGKDGASKPQITNRLSLDDVIRANDGAFIDLASNY